VSSSELAATVARPAGAVEVGDVLASARRAVVRGAGTKADWGAPVPDPDVVVDMTAMDEVLEHAAGDLVVHAQAGVRLTDLAAALAPARQRLAVDEVVPGSTVGGVLATGLAGPLRASHGGVRDLVLGVGVVLADGRRTVAGGRVVKNVAGYDLSKLHTGAYGTLGVITDAWLRLHPAPERAAWVPVEDLAEADALRPAAVDLRGRPGESPALVALVEGTDRGVAGRLAARPEIDRPPWWATLPGLGDGETLVKVTTTRTGVAEVAACAERLGSVELAGSAACGILWAGIGAGVPARAVADAVTALRAACARAGGFASALRAPAAVRELVDAWGPAPGLELMRRVKDELDPEHRLAPGRFVGGI
jgi:glycolate oxidase FAD binding subunit